jgi:thiopurine S-methyltransferase
VWDRAALVALDPKDRPAYLDTLWRVLVPGGLVLLVTFTYDQKKLPGPPWSVSDDDVQALCGERFTIERILTRDEALGPKFIEAGVTSLTESLYALQKR